MCVAVTSNLKWADAPGNVLLEAKATGLDRNSVANVSQIVTIDKTTLLDRVGRISRAKLQLIIDGIELVLGR